MPEHTLSAVLAPLPEPFHGATVSADDFTFFDDGERHGWTVRVGEDPNATVFWVYSHIDDDALLPTVGYLYCRYATNGNGVSVATAQPFPNPFTRVVAGAAPLRDWYDAICLFTATAAAEARSAGQWGGDGFDAMMRRSELGITSYQEQEVAVRSFRNLAALQDWLDGALSATQVRVEAYVLTDFPYERGDSRPGHFSQVVVADEIVGYVPIAVTTTFGSVGWFAATDSGPGPRPSATLRMSGSQRISLDASIVQDWAGLQQHAVLTGGNIALPRPGGWIVLGVVGTNVALAVPARDANIVVYTDGDGSLVTVSVHPAEEREAEHRRRTEFERGWGRWLDDSVALSDTELHERITEVERTLHRLIKEDA